MQLHAAQPTNSTHAQRPCCCGRLSQPLCLQRSCAWKPTASVCRCMKGFEAWLLHHAAHRPTASGPAARPATCSSPEVHTQSGQRMPAPARMICPPGLQSVRPDHEAAGQEPSLIKRAHKGCTVQMHEHASSKHSVLQSWSAARLLLTWGLTQNSSRHMMTKDPSISSRRDKKA